MKIIKAQQKGGLWILLLAWLLVIAVPAAVFRGVFDYFLETRLKQSIQRVRPLLYVEMQHFIEDLNDGPWLESQLKEFDLKNHFVTSPKSMLAQLHTVKGAAKVLHKRLEEHLGFPVFSVFCYGPDTVEVDASVKKIPECLLKAPPGSLLKRFFAINNNQAKRKLAPAEEAKNRRIYSENFLQNYFGTIVSFNVVPGEIVRTIAGKAGKTGPLFLYYGLARSEEGNNCRNFGGYFAAIRLQDIPECAIIRGVVTKPFYPAFVRKTGFLKQSLPVPDNFADKNLSGFIMEKDKYSLYTVAPQKQLVRLAQRGTINPSHLQTFSKHTAGLKVSCPVSELEHPLARVRSLIELFLGLLCMAGSMIFFRLFLFGFDLQLTIAIKITSAIIFSCFLPVFGLLLSTIAHSDYEADADREKIFRQLKMKNSLLQILINNKISRCKQYTQDLAANLLTLQNESKAVHEQYLAEWCKARPVAGVIYKKFDSPQVEFWNKQFQQDSDFKVRRDAKWLLLNSALGTILSSSVISKDRSTVPSFLSVTTNDTGDSQFMSNKGKLVAMRRLSRASRASMLLVQKSGMTKGLPVGLMIVDYDVFLLIDDVLQAIKGEIILHQDDGDLQIDLALGQVKNGRVKLLSEFSSDAISPDQALRQMESCFKLNKEIQWVHRTNDSEIFSLAYFDQNLPLVVLTQISKLSSANFSSLLWLPVLYAILVTMMVLLLTRLFFIRPILKLANGLEEIAQGNLQHQLVLETGDEFEVIGNECNQMTESLIEKAMLEQYVSADVLAEVRKSSEAELQPGGERIDATVLFASLHSRNTGEARQSEAMIDLVNLFLCISDTISTQNGGIVDKIIGQTLMIVFRNSETGVHHQLRACSAAWQIKSAFENGEIAGNYLFSAGISSGSLVSGKIGSKIGKLDYTVIGNVVNTAARLKAHAEMLDDSAIICSDDFANLQFEQLTVKPEAEIRIKGKAERCRIYRLGAI